MSVYLITKVFFEISMTISFFTSRLMCMKVEKGANSGREVMDVTKAVERLGRWVASR